jgi:cytochrome c oxidase cbb3-type subunit 3
VSEHDRLIEHEYDGIQEFDNPMPRWWVLSFWATIIYSALYLLNIGPFGIGRGRLADYEADVTAWRAAHPVEGGATDSTTLLAAAADPAQVAAGKATFTSYCAACHAADGGGAIGPNLTDQAWLHGHTITDIHRVVSEGVPAKGMPAWSRQLTPAQVQAVVGYVWSLRGSTPAAPKAPEGTVPAP